MPWTQWTECSEACGLGIDTRYRECDEPLNGGAACEGEMTQSRPCTIRNCPSTLNLIISKISIVSDKISPHLIFC